jgi:hypothetical protein
MTAAPYNTVIDQGADWFINFVYEDPDCNPINITGATAAMQFRSLPEDTVAVLTLTTENGGITITGAEGKLAVHATATQTGNIDAGYYYYDVEIYMEGVTTRLIQGQVLVSAQVTR